MKQESDLIMAFDPGGTTGYVYHYLRHLNVNKYTGGNFDYVGAWGGGQIGPNKHHKELWTLLCRENPTAIVCEDFDYRILRDKDDTYDRGGISLISRDYIGVIELYCELTGTPLHMQKPTIKAIEWLKDPALKKLGIYKTSNQHQNDASRHLLHHIVVSLNRKDALNALRQRIKSDET